MREPKLTSERVAEIRQSSLPDTHWAALFGVGRHSVRRARVGRTHRDCAVAPQSETRRPRSDIGSKRNGEPSAFDAGAVSMQGEEWRPVLGWERFYRVSNFGRIYSLHQTGRLARGMRVRDGYNVLKLRDGERRAHGVVHRLVLEAFVGPAPQPHYEGCHNDGDPANCRLDNLRWDTPSANQADRIKHGTSSKGRPRGAQIPADVVRQIRADLTITQKEWAERLGCHPATISCIRRGATHKEVA